MLKRLYQKYLRGIPAAKETVFFIKKMLRYARGEYRRYTPPAWTKVRDPQKADTLKIAVICDEFTWINFQNAADAVYLSPQNWLEQMERERPDVFFCEATWEGIDGSWINGIYRNHEYRQDNRSVLKDILRYCREAEIPTVFWNKEDTPKFQDKPFSFIDTALLFDHIFTTTEECIPKYRSLGHESVHLMMFGYSPELFFDRAPRPNKGIAVFLGSWYAANRERCEDMCRMFDMVLEQGMELRIYDRISEQDEPDRRYPQKYAPYIFPAVPYERTGEIMSGADYVININSVKDSKTMFARRVFEAMACGRLVISNESIGMRQLFPGRVWFEGEHFERSEEGRVVKENLEAVRADYMFRTQLFAALQEADI